MRSVIGFLLIVGLLGGACWNVAAEEMDVGDVMAIAADPDDADTLYIGTTKGLFSVSHLAKTPKLTCIGMPDIAINALAFDPAASGATLYVGTFAWGLYEFTSDGGDWTYRKVDDVATSGINDLKFDIKDPGTLYVVANRHLYKSVGTPRTFERLRNTPKNVLFERLFLDPAAPEIMRLKGFTSEYFISSNGGESWEDDPTLKTYLHSWVVDKKVTSMCANVNQERVICWRAMAVLLSDSIKHIDFFPEDHRTLLVSTFGNGLYKVRRIQNKWEVTGFESTENKPIYSTLVRNFDPLDMYIGSANGILHTTDGVTWAPVW
ncbi:hypothetical protein JW905_17445 [bacterium]|nr:hypothetical protein [candidate division CSSED10-310 bacterium]